MCIHTHMKYYTHINYKKEGNLVILTTGIKQQDIMLSEISQGEKDKYYMFSCVEAKKN